MTGFNQYGRYALENDGLSLSLPTTKIKITKIFDSSIRYIRKSNSPDKKLEKIIAIQNTNPEFVLCPVFPIHTPVQKTRDFVFLRLKNSYQMGARSSSTLSLQFPIEIGFFIKRNEVLERIDAFTCEPKNARFALYGNPQKGDLCKFAKVDLANEQNITRYAYSKISVSIQNELSKEISIGKFVFPISYSKMHYDKSNAYVDGIKARVHEIQEKHLVEISNTGIKEDVNDLELSPSGNHKNNSKIMYTMDRGFD